MIPPCFRWQTLQTQSVCREDLRVRRYSGVGTAVGHMGEIVFSQGGTAMDQSGDMGSFLDFVLLQLL